MYKHIMVPLDGSHAAEEALATGADLAQRSGATLHLTRVVSWLHELTDMSTPGSPKRYVTRLAQNLAASYGINVSVDLLSDAINGVAYGEPPRRAIAEVLDEFIAASAVDLSVMTTHGRGGFKRFWIGSVADSMLRMSNGSILMLRSRKPVRNKGAMTGSRILVPIDIDGRDEELVARAIELGELYGADYTLLHVASPALSPGAAGDTDAEIDKAAGPPHAYLDRLATALADTGHRVSVAVVTMPFIASEILAYADEHQFDMIAVSTRSSTWVKRAVLGSVADKVIRGSATPVFACNTR